MPGLKFSGQMLMEWGLFCNFFFFLFTVSDFVIPKLRGYDIIITAQ